MNDLKPLPTQFTIQIEFLSDWHIGSGLGRPGDVDRLVQRDADGLPFVPGKTLTGILRDAAERVAIALDSGEPNGWDGWYAWLRSVFGDQPALAAVTEDEIELVDSEPRPALLSIRPARFSRELRDALRPAARGAVREALIHVKPGVAIDPETGSALERHLRFEEMVRGGVTLTAEATWDDEAIDSGASRAAVTALLVAAAETCERLGGKRRRGAGRVRITLPEGPAVGEVADWLERQPAPPPLPDRQSQIERLNCDLGQAIADPGAAMGDDADWKRLPLRVELLSPLLIADRTVGNVVEGLEYVPGTFFLPLVQRILRNAGVNAASAIQKGMVRVAPATVEIQGQRSLPVPAALHRPKTGGGFREDRGVANRLREPEKSTADYVKNYRAGYVAPALEPKRLPRYEQPRLVLRMHNTVKDDIQRPHEDVGGVYTYQALAAGTVLRTEIMIHPTLAVDLARLRDSLGQIRYRIGRSKKDDYGHVKITTLADRDDREQSSQEDDRWKDTTRFTVWLTSDALLLDDSLGSATTLEALRRHVAQALRLPAEQLDVVGFDNRPNAFLRAARHESWQTRWCLPRPSLIGVAAGSCVEFEVNQGGVIAGKELWRLERDGIGERRAEGYGMLCVQHPLLDAETSKWAVASVIERDSPQGPLIDAEQPDYSMARQLELASWRRMIAQTATELALDKAFRQKWLGLDCDRGKPASSQAAAVRNAVKRLRNATDAPAVIEWLKHVAKLRRDRWPAAALSNEGGKLVELLDNDGQVWNALRAGGQGGESAEDFPTLTRDAAGSLRQQLWAEAVRTLMVACLRAHQHDLDSSPPKGADDGETD